MKKLFFIVAFLTYGLAHADLETRANEYKSRYGLNNTFQKLTDNRGDGYDELYGTRNLRVVLHGVLYRGGANNKFNREKKRDNMNPLPDHGLENLCREGFEKAVYHYSENYDTAPHQIECQAGGNKNIFHYDQLSPGVKEDAEKMLKTIYQNIKNKNGKPMYFHCWNGWHASGLISAYALMQFCDLKNDQAVSYWNLHTDGWDDEPSFEKIRDRIRNFKPLSSLRISNAEKKAICPQIILNDPNE